MATKVQTRGGKQSERGRQLPALERNAFRTLGLAASASQGEIHERATSLRLAHQLGVEKTFDADLAWLGPLSRAESDVRDALGRLADPPQRILERLFWFHTLPTVEPPAETAQIREAVHALLRAEGPSARHDAALLSLAALQSLDPGFNERDAWVRAYALWRDVLEREEFWSLLVASDLKGEFEQLANHGEVKALCARAPRLLTASLVERAREAVTRDDFETAARVLDILRAAALPETLLGEYENAVLGPVEDRAETLCVAAFGDSLFSGGGDRLRHKHYFDEAWKNFHWRVKPFLGRFLLLAGARSRALRRSCELAAENLHVLAAGYKGQGFDEQSRHVYRQSRALAPPSSTALAVAEEGLRSLDPSAVLVARDETEYAAALAAELADRSVPPKLFEGEVLVPATGGGTDTVEGCVGQIAFYAVVIVLCFLLDKCGVINTRRTRTLPPTFNFNYNYNYNAPRIVIPPMPNLEPLNIPPLTPPTTTKRKGRRQNPARPQPKRNESGTPDEPPLLPPTTTTRAPRREGASPSPAATPKN
ncbi:MAG TPA: hypothetical protein VFS10_22560 [Pyrinomonadaceae bacterium]|nr:hypothetical protein [Pyrinomonadaceae bacterium]